MDNAEIGRRIAKLEKDMWIGNGKPGMTTRIAIMEEVVGKINKNLSRITWLLIATLVGVIVKFFTK